MRCECESERSTQPAALNTRCLWLRRAPDTSTVYVLTLLLTYRSATTNQYLGKMEHSSTSPIDLKQAPRT